MCRLGKPLESEAAFTEAAKLIKESQILLQAELEFARGKCALSNNRAEAQVHFAKAAALSHNIDSFLEAFSLLTLGYLSIKDGDYQRAIDVFKQGLSITDSRLLHEPILGNLGECYAELGDWRQAISFSEQAENLAAQLRNADDEEAWLIDLGRAHFALREYSAAESFYDRALAIAKGQNDTDGIWRCLKNLTQLALRRNDLSTAERYWKEESAMAQDPEKAAYVAFDAAEIALQHKDMSSAESLLKKVLYTKTSDSLRLTSERELGNVYWQENKTIDADRTYQNAIEHAEAVVAKLPPRYQMSFLDEDPFYDSYVRFLVAHDRNLEALQIAERGRGQILSQALQDKPGTKSVFDLKALQAVLKKRNQIALAYSLTDDESFVWVITPVELKLFHLPSHRELRPQIDAYNAEIVSHPRAIDDSPAGQQLYNTLIQPAESLIPKGSRVVVISSKILSLVNFEALIVPGDHPHYWIEDVEVETAGSLALLEHSKPITTAPPGKKEMLIVGAPIPADNSLPILKHAAEEMDRVRSHFPAGQETIIAGQDAVPAAYQASSPGDYRFIHIDAHSVASDLSPLDSFVVLSPSPSGYQLFAHDIEKTRLHADLVTISACYSAGTRWYQGEGIVGLGWAFLRAGAHQVVASLWAVDEASTPQLMDDFYRELSQGKSAAQALRDAKLNMLHSGGQTSRPFYWASLQLYTGS